MEFFLSWNNIVSKVSEEYGIDYSNFLFENSSNIEYDSEISLPESLVVVKSFNFIESKADISSSILVIARGLANNGITSNCFILNIYLPILYLKSIIAKVSCF